MFLCELVVVGWIVERVSRYEAAVYAQPDYYSVGKQKITTTQIHIRAPNSFYAAYKSVAHNIK